MTPRIVIVLIIGLVLGIMVGAGLIGGNDATPSGSSSTAQANQSTTSRTKANASGGTGSTDSIRTTEFNVPIIGSSDTLQCIRATDINQSGFAISCNWEGLNRAQRSKRTGNP